MRRQSLRRNSSGSLQVDPRRPPPFFVKQASSPYLRPGGNDGGQGLGALLAVGCAGAVLSAVATASVFVAWVQRMVPPRLYYMPTRENLALVMAMPLVRGRARP